MLHVLQPAFKPVSQQTRLLQVVWLLTFDWIKLRGSLAIHGELRHLLQNRFALGR